jgi:membrane-associated protease RseP (regulator of RpoE activity)
MSKGMDETYESQSKIVPAEVVEILPPDMRVSGSYLPPSRQFPPRRILRPVILFIATCLSTFYVALPFQEIGTKGWMFVIGQGLQYSVPLMTILVCHEMGHFLQSYRYGVYATLPYFIPIPIPPIGTMGAVIFMEPRMGHRRALFDIGITGPLAGLVPTIICCVVGIRLSTVLPIQEISGQGVGAPYLFQLIVEFFGKNAPDGFFLKIHPIAFAGWVGLLITSLNLIPIGQLDGGHILYALLRKKSYYVSTFLLLAAVAAVIYDWRHLVTWWMMIALLFFMGPKHPPTADDDEPLGIFRYILGWLTLAFVVIGFTPYAFVLP